MRVPPAGTSHTPRAGDTVRILAGQWKGWQGRVDAVLESGDVAVRFGSGFVRTFLREDVKVTG